MEQIQIEVNGTLRQVRAIKKEGSHYVRLRDLGDEKIQVDYDGMRRVPVVKVL